MPAYGELMRDYPRQNTEMRQQGVTGYIQNGLC